MVFDYNLVVRILPIPLPDGRRFCAQAQIYRDGKPFLLLTDHYGSTRNEADKFASLEARDWLKVNT